MTNEATLDVTPRLTVDRGRRPRSAWRQVEISVALTCTAVLFGCGGPHGTAGNNTPPSSPPMLAVLSAFPGEMAPVLARATIERTEMVDNRLIRIGTISGVPVVIGMTGIGLVNAAATTRAVLERFPVEGVVVSAVAGSPYRIGDVVVPAEWFETDGPTYAADQEWLAIAEEITAPGAIDFESCTSVPNQSPDPVCLSTPPVLIVGGLGRSSDPFGGTAAPCFPNGNDVFGCDLKDDTGSAMIVFYEANHAGGLDADVPVAEDMETAAIAAEADAHDVPFIAFRAVSDGDGDPLNLPGFPTQFFAYYHLAANNAAAATAAFLEQIAAAHR